jgi:hypothetical protein
VRKPEPNNASEGVFALSEVLVLEISPAERPILEHVLHEQRAGALGQAARQKADPLGMGLGSVAALAQLATPLLIAAAEWLLKEVAQKAASEVLIKKIKGLFEQQKAPGSSEPLAVALSPEELVLAGNLLTYLKERGSTLGIPSPRVEALHRQISGVLVKAITTS